MGDFITNKKALRKSSVDNTDLKIEEDCVEVILGVYHIGENSRGEHAILHERGLNKIIERANRQKSLLGEFRSSVQSRGETARPFNEPPPVVSIPLESAAFMITDIKRQALDDNESPLHTVTATVKLIKTPMGEVFRKVIEKQPKVRFGIRGLQVMDPTTKGPDKIMEIVTWDLIDTGEPQYNTPSKRLKLSARYMEMAGLYKVFGQGWDNLDWSDQALQEMHDWESKGIPMKLPRNGYENGKKWMDVTVAMWKEDLPKGIINRHELYQDAKFPHWWLDKVLPVVF